MYIAIPRELYEALINGEITDSMYESMTWLHYRANWATGRVKKVCAENICMQTHRRCSIRAYQDALKNLSDCGWITTHRSKGQQGSYWVTIHNFVALTGAQANQMLNPKKIIPYKNGEPPECADQCGDGAATGALTVRRECGDGATILEIQSLSEIPEPSETHETTNLPNHQQGADAPLNGHAQERENHIGNSNGSSDAPEKFFGDGQEVTVGRDDYSSDPVVKRAWTLEQLARCFPAYRNNGNASKLSLDELRMMYEVCLACDSACLYPHELLDHAKKHNTRADQQGLVPRSVRQLWNAVCGPSVSVTNGILAQYKACAVAPCKKCVTPEELSIQKRQEENQRALVSLPRQRPRSPDGFPVD